MVFAPTNGQLAVVGTDHDAAPSRSSRDRSGRILAGLRERGWALHSVRSTRGYRKKSKLDRGRVLEQGSERTWKRLQAVVQPAQDWRTVVRASRQQPLSAVLSMPGCLSHHAQAAYARRHLGLPWIAVVSDYERELVDDETSRRGPWERGLHYAYQQLFLDADSVVVDSDSAQEFWSAQLPAVASRCRRIYSFWEQSPAKGRSRSARGPISLAVINDEHAPASLRPVISVLEVLRDRFPELSGALELTVFGGVLARELPLCREWTIEVAEALDSSQPDADLVLVLARGRDQNVLSSGFWPALATGRPVISLGGCDEAARLLRKTGLGLHISWNERGWVDRGAAVLQRAVFRRYNERSLLSEYAPRWSSLGDYSAQSATKELEKVICALNPKSCTWIPDDESSSRPRPCCSELA